MHRHKFARTLRSLKFSAWHLILNILLGFGAVIVFIYSVLIEQQLWNTPGGFIIVLWLASALLFFIRRFSVRCPLCVVSPWINQKCQRNRKVKKALGVSYRLRVALAIIFRDSYRCPYCGERFSSRVSRKD